jgi:UDP-N-acetylglucosamine 2-epimerase (non-hydrolysing)
MVVFGTRPEAVKMSPLIKALVEDPDLVPIIVVTGQHREMLDPILQLFGIEPDFDLAVMTNGQTLTEITARTLERLFPIIVSEAPDALVVQGDTTAAMVGALAAFYQHVPVVHLEAGLRSGDREAPFPEEVNRRLISVVTEVNLAPTEGARRNLLHEGVDPAEIFVIGNTGIDALLWAVEQRAPYGNAILDKLDQDDRPMILVTAHRRESWGKPMQEIGRAIAAIAAMEPDVLIVLPIHRNPIVRSAILPYVEHIDNVVVTEPISYGSFARLMTRALFIISDSGGIQEEGSTLGKPVLVMRESTERGEAVDAGGIRLVGTHSSQIIEEAERLLHDPTRYRSMAVPRMIFGDGYAARRAVDAIAHYFGLRPACDEFVADVSPKPMPRLPRSA